MLNDIEKSVIESIRTSLKADAAKLIEEKTEDIRRELWSNANEEIERIISLISIEFFDNVISMTRELHISLKGKL